MPSHRDREVETGLLTHQNDQMLTGPDQEQDSRREEERHGV